MDASTASERPPRRRRIHDPERTRRAILDAATALFADKGFDGANVAEIVARAETTKPMIYYHFGSKEGLFAAVLEEVYARMRAIEGSLDLAALPPEGAMRRLVEVTFDYHADHPDWVRLISTANIHDAQHIAGSRSVAARNTPVLAILGEVLGRGEREGAFRPGIDPLHLHLLINSFCFYRVSNRHTWRVIFERDLASVAEVKRQRAVVVAAVLAFLRAEGAGPPADDDRDRAGRSPRPRKRSAEMKRRVPARRVGLPVSFVWLTPSMTGTSGKSKGLTPSRQATLTA